LNHTLDENCLGLRIEEQLLDYSGMLLPTARSFAEDILLLWSK